MCLAALAGWVLVAGGGQESEFHGHLPIDVPKEASVNFEADAPASEMIPLLQQLLSGTLGDPTAGAGAKIRVHTPLGTVDLDPKDLALLLQPVRELHVVSFTSAQARPMEHYEHEFSAEGLQKVSTPGGSDPVLLMKGKGSGGLYAVVVHQGKQITVVRTDGMPDLGTVGDLALRKLAEAGSRIRHKVKPW